MPVCMLLPGVVRDFFFSYSLPLLNYGIIQKFPTLKYQYKLQFTKIRSHSTL